MSTVSSLSLSTLQVEILFAIFKLLDRPSKLSLGLTGPHFLRLFASYYDLERYRSDEPKWRKLGIPEGVSSYESPAQPAIIRWLSASGCDDIDNPQQVKEEDYSPAAGPNDIEASDDFIVPYEETEEAMEDAMVENIISDWLRAKFNINGGCILCADCYRYMLVLGPDGEITSWLENMLNRPACSVYDEFN